VTVTDEYMVCGSCGEEFYAGGQASALEKRASQQARSEYRILPFEIRALRKKLGRTQEEMEQYLGYGDKLWTRWERGVSTPEGAAVALLRLLERDSSVLLELAQLHGVSTAPPEKDWSAPSWGGALIGSQETNPYNRDRDVFGIKQDKQIVFRRESAQIVAPLIHVTDPGYIEVPPSFSKANNRSLSA
jgi:putative zinc finger/helix-turn-helix YgiT family protein